MSRPLASRAAAGPHWPRMMREEAMGTLIVALAMPPVAGSRAADFRSLDPAKVPALPGAAKEQVRAGLR